MSFISEKHWDHWVIYKSPLDAPGKWVVRKWNVLPPPERPTEVAFVGDTLEAVRARVPEGMTCMARSPDDDPSIFEVWL